MKYQRPILFVMLLMTVVATALAPDPPAQVVEIATRADETNAEKSPASKHKPDQLLKKRADLSSPLVLFSTPPIAIPEVAPVLPPLPLSPQAPPLPFRVLGRYIDQKGMHVFLENEQRGIAVRVGDVIDQLYEVKAIEGTSMTFIYLPSRQAQTLDIGMPPFLMNQP